MNSRLIVKKTVNSNEVVEVSITKHSKKTVNSNEVVEVILTKHGLRRMIFNLPNYLWDREHEDFTIEKIPFFSNERMSVSRKIERNTKSHVVS